MFFFQAEDGIRDRSPSRGLGDVYKRQEHNIRTLVNLCWMNHKDTLEEMAGCTMADKPTNSEFIDILVYYLRYSDKD